MQNIVGTTEAAYLLNISVSRLKVLSQEGRVRGAKKENNIWRIPLYNGMPRIQERGKGLKGTWRKKRCKKNTVVHVNKNQINRNRKHNTHKPVITVRQGSHKTYCHLAEIKGSCKIVYRPDRPLRCGAVVWIEVVPDTVVIPQIFEPIKLAIA